MLEKTPVRACASGARKERAMSEPYTIKMPQLSETMTEGTVVSWEKRPGDANGKCSIRCICSGDRP
jgi:dihydrolipoamide dehydrogenase